MRSFKTERLMLRPFTEAEIEGMYQLVYGDPEVCGRYFSKLLTLAETRERMRLKIVETPRNDYVSLAMARKADGALMGLIQLYANIPDHIVLEEHPATPCDTVEPADSASKLAN